MIAAVVIVCVGLSAETVLLVATLLSSASAIAHIETSYAVRESSIHSSKLQRGGLSVAREQLVR